MNKYISKLFGVMFQSQQIQQTIHAQSQHLLTSSEEWHAYWQAKSFPWRTEAEIDVKRQEELSKCRAIVPDIKQGIYPFRGMKLSRADVEWLLATHENGRGPVDWKDESQRGRDGLDLRGADLCQLDLSNLPLAGLRVGLKPHERNGVTDVQRNMSVTFMKGSDLYKAHLEGANLYKVHLENAHLSEAYLSEAHFYRTRLEGANLRLAHLEDAYFYRSSLSEANLENIFLSNEKHIGPYMLDINWNDVNIAVIDWNQIRMLRNEYDARQEMLHGQVKNRAVRLEEYIKAVRANRQLAVALQEQGLNENAAHFTYCAQILQRKAFWAQRHFGKWLFSMFLALLTGYGYRMGRILAAYLLIVFLCALAYFVVGIYHAPHLTLLQAFLESITAFHGRVFYELFTPDTPQIWVTAFEAIAGLIIESVFIAMLTQRFFGK